MSTYKNFKDTKKKIQVLWEQSKQQQDEANKLKKITVSLNDTAFTKAVYKQQIVNNVILQTPSGSGSYSLTVEFSFLPIWAIPMVKVIPILTTPSAFPISELNFSTVSTKKRWKQMGENHYELKIDFASSIFGISSNPTATLNCWLYIINQNDYSLTQTEGN